MRGVFGSSGNLKTTIDPPGKIAVFHNPPVGGSPPYEINQGAKSTLAHLHGQCASEENHRNDNQDYLIR